VILYDIIGVFVNFFTGINNAETNPPLPSFHPFSGVLCPSSVPFPRLGGNLKERAQNMTTTKTPFKSFSLGQIVATSGVIETVPNRRILEYLSRHVRGDCGLPDRRFS
jgi:hypothetical protein